jgi:prolyl-tRNA synthetase
MGRVEEYIKVLAREKFVRTSDVKGGNVLMPNCIKSWEKMKALLQEKLSEEGFENWYFPMFIRVDKFKKQEEHFKGFFEELVIAKHVGDKDLEHELAIRPTSEIVMYDSLREILNEEELPLKLNQFCSVVRWEFKRANVPLLRDNEFLWQESHSMHATEEEALAMTAKMLANYKEIIEEKLCLPCVVGEKPNRRKFAGAKKTFAIEALMPDGKSIQLATSHYLGQNFSEVFDLKKNGGAVYQCCHGITTRALGSAIFYYFNEDGINLPPAISPKEIENAEEIQKEFAENAKAYLKEHFFQTENKEEFNKLLNAQSGFVETNWCGNDDCSYEVKKWNGSSLRITKDAFSEKKCLVCGKDAVSSAVFAPSY